MFENREQAGRMLARALEEYRSKDPVIVALPRGGVAVGYEVARHLGAPLDVRVCKKIGAPGDPELAVAALTEEGRLLYDPGRLRLLGVDVAYLHACARRLLPEIQGRLAGLRGAAPRRSLRDRTVILVDDGLATGATMEAAVYAARQEQAREVVVAVPVGPPDTVERLARLADRVVCLEQPWPFLALGQFYRDFRQMDDDEVRRLLEEAASWSEVPGSA